MTNFTIKWCLEHQVDWKQFQEGKQLINNIPGQIAFADKVNLWYTIRDYLNSRRNLLGNNIQTFLPMTFVLDDENEVTEFLRVYKSKFDRTKKKDSICFFFKNKIELGYTNHVIVMLVKVFMLFLPIRI